MSRSTLSRTRCLRLIPRSLEKGVFVALLGPSGWGTTMPIDRGNFTRRLVADMGGGTPPQPIP